MFDIGIVTGGSLRLRAWARIDTPKARIARTGTKQAMLIGMLNADAGATINEIVAATSWQPKTVRGAIASALKTKLRLDVTSETVEGRGRVYHPPRA